MGINWWDFFQIETSMVLSSMFSKTPKSSAIRAIGNNTDCFFIFYCVITFHGFWHRHFFSIPCLTTPTNAIGIDDASTGSTASWVFTHGCSFIQVQGFYSGRIKLIDAASVKVITQ